MPRHTDAVRQALSMGEFTPDEQACISAKVSKLVDEGKEQDEAVAIAIKKCAPDKAQGAKMTSRRATHVAMGYRATRTDKALIVHDVPIFCACKRDDFTADERWVKAAVEKAMADARGGYYPPLHIRHHEPETAMNDSVRRAGHFEILGVRPITLSGKRRNAVFADLHIKDEWAQQEVMSELLPYRSVEIFDIAERPSIDGLALLDHEAPFLRLPMLMVSTVDDQTTQADSPVPIGTFSRSWRMDARQTNEPVVACFRQGSKATLLFRQENTMANETPEAKGTAQATLFADDDKPKDKEGGESAQGDTKLDVAAVVKAIESGEISVADMDAILAAIQAQGATKEPDVDQPAPAAVPGGEAMAADGSLIEQFVGLKAENVKMRADIQTMQEQAVREKDVAVAMKRLEGRALGDIEGDLTTFHKDHGPQAFAKFVAHLAKHNGVLPEDAEPTTMKADAPEVAMKYADKGKDAVEQATGFAKQWEWLSKNTRMTTPLEKYVEINMEKALTA